MSAGIESARAQWELIAEIERKGSTRSTIAKLYRHAIVFGDDDIDWGRINEKILERYTRSGLEYIKKLAWGYGAAGRRAVAGW